MKKIAILGGENILGSGVIERFLRTKAANYELRIYDNRADTQKNDYSSATRELTVDSFSPWSPGTFQQICRKDSENNPDYIINCLELEPSKIYDNVAIVYINSYFPLALSRWANSCGVKVIHASSADSLGITKEKSQYGLTKQLGESNDCMILRIDTPIGKCPRGKEGILSYLNSFKETGETLKASPRFLLNNITNLEFGNVCKVIIDKNLYRISSTNIFSPTPLPYFHIIKLLNEKYKLNINIEPDNEGVVRKETLSDSSGLHDKLEIKHLEEQIKNL